jgi:hypothetical protein
MADERHSTTLDIKVDDREIVKLAEQLERTFPLQLIDSFNKSLERQTDAVNKLVEAQGKLARTTEDQAKKSMEATDKQTAALRRFMQFNKTMADDSARDRRGGVAGGAFGGSFAGTMLGNWMSRAGGAGAGMFGAPSGLGLISMASAVPVAGPILSAAGSAIMQLRQEFVQQQAGRMAGISGAGLDPFSSKRLIQSGLRFGMTPGQMGPYLAQQAGVTGLTGGALGGIAPDLMGFGKFAGIENAGSVVRAAGTGRVPGAVDEARQKRLMIDTVGAGVIGGIRESDLGPFMEEMSSYVIGARTSGMQIDPEEMNALFRGLRGNGGSFVGEAGSRAAVNIAGGTAKLGMGGGWMDVEARQAAGFTGQPGGRSLPEVLLEIERHPGQVFDKVLGQLRQRGAGVGAGSMMALLENQPVFSQLSREQRFDVMSGKKTFTEIFAEQDAAGGAAEATKGLLSGRGAMAQGPLGTAQQEASFSAARATLGGVGAITRAVTSLRQADMDKAQILLPKAAEVIVAAVEFIGVALDQALKLAGVGKKTGRKKGRGGYDAPDASYNPRDIGDAFEAYIFSMSELGASMSDSDTGRGRVEAEVARDNLPKRLRGTTKGERAAGASLSKEHLSRTFGTRSGMPKMRHHLAVSAGDEILMSVDANSSEPSESDISGARH